MIVPKGKNSFFYFFNAVFLALAAAIFLVTVLCGVIFFNLFSSAGDVVENTVPSINRITKINSDVQLLSTLFPRLRVLQAETELDELSGILDETIQKIAIASNNLLAPPEIMHELEEAITDLVTKKDVNIELARTNYRDSQRLALQSEALLDSLETASREVKILYIETETRLFSHTRESEALLTFAQTQFLSNVSQDLELVTIMVLNSKREESPDQIEKVQEEFNSLFRNIVFSLSKSQQSNTPKINQALRDTYQLSLSNDNYFTNARLHRQQLAQLSLGTDSLETSLNRISNVLRPLIETQTQQDQLALNSLLRTSKIYFALLVLLAVLSLIFVAIMINKVVPKKITLPLKSMATDIIELSKNNIEEVNFNHDSVELAEIRQALLIFQQNAKDLHSQNRRLNQFNDHLKTFLRVSSHDLRTPLRGINLLVSMIEECVEENDKDTLSTHLERIRTRTKRMENLLISLTEYMRIEQPKVKLTNLNVEKLTIEQFDLLNENENFSIAVKTELHTICVNEIPFKTVLRNLIDNALKHHDMDVGEISVNINDLGQQVSVSVSDDGPGIEKQYHDRVFKPFETLQPKDEVEGSGMGLSIIQKIVEVHGGKTTLVSPVSGQRGSCFTFTWNKET